MIYSLVSMFRAKSLLPCVFFSLLVLSSCAAHRPSGPSPVEPVEVMGPPIPESHVEEQEVPTETYGPEAPSGPISLPATATSTATDTALSTSTASASATQTAIGTATSTSTAVAEPARLCLVLGPGMAKAMAEAAVLEALRKAKIPVHCVVGTEMGAIVGALYAHSNGNTNNLQWQLFKLNKDNYFNFPMLSLREPKSSGRKLNEFLRGVFHDAQVDRLPIRFATTAVEDEGDNSTELDRGDLADALSASVAIPGVFDSWKIGGTSYHSAAPTEPAPIELARRLGGNFIVMVDVLLDSAPATKSRFHRAFTGARSVMKLQRKEAQFVIQVNTGAIAFDDFGRRADILASGTAAAEKSMPELKAAWEKWLAAQH